MVQPNWHQTLKNNKIGLLALVLRWLKEGKKVSCYLSLEIVGGDDFHLASVVDF